MLAKVMMIHMWHLILDSSSKSCLDQVNYKLSPRPNKNLCITKKEPIGPVGLIVPWNYPLMMLAWKMGAALATGEY